MRIGTRIAKVAKPIAKTLDSIWGTDLANCEACDRMTYDLDHAKNVWDFVDAVKDRFGSQQEGK